MGKAAFKADALRHVRFSGRPTIALSHFTARVKPILPVARHATALGSERPSQFISWVFERVGLAVDSYRGEPLQRRLSACLRALHVETEARACQLLERQPDLLPTAIGALLIGVTEFFRDPVVFETLRTEILPQLVSHTRPLRVWSAGCSNGAELYSLAILLAELGLLEDSFLLGSDCRHDAIDHAQTALYHSNEVRNVSLSDRHKYFNETGSFWQPIEMLRRHVHWKVSDLAKSIEEGLWDIILWRNMAIYLNAESAESVWRGLACAVAPQGVLIVGKAERPPAELRLINMKRCIYRSCSHDGELTVRLRTQLTSHSYTKSLETPL